MGQTLPLEVVACFWGKKGYLEEKAGPFFFDFLWQHVTVADE